MQRRTFIKSSSLTALSISAFGSLSWNGNNFEGDTPTTTDILGPFYRPGAPLRTNLRLSNSNGTPIVLKGNIFKEDGKTPIANALVEIWHCDENEVYDNTSDEYKYRGGQKTRADGKYEFKSILPVPYKATPSDESSWRPSHIHLRISVPDQQDLITQIYFKGGKYVETDNWASSPQAANRILKISENKSGESEVIFNVNMGKEIPLDKKVYDKITGLYQMDKNTFEFNRMDDLLFVKFNGQLVSSLKYIGNNTFEEKIEQLKVVFELLPNDITKANIEYYGNKMSGERFLKYKD